MPIEIISTGDGSHSLLNTDLDETYHSRHGAVQESEHVFIKHGFDFFCEKSSGDAVRILEVGFGTGLNVWLTAMHSITRGRNVHYTSLETFPLSQEIWQKLNYASDPVAKSLFDNIHQASWQEDVVISEN